MNGDTDPYPCIQEYNQVRSAGMTWNTGDDEFWHYGGQSRDWLPYLYYDFMFRRGKARLRKAPGWISAKVSSKGVVNWAGRLGDGAPILGSSALGLTGADDGSRSFLISYVRKDEVLSAQGLVTLTPDLSDTLLSGHFEAVENFANLAKRDRTCRAGLPVHSVTVDGGRYTQPANGQNMFTSVAPENIALALPDSQQPLLIPINLGRDAASSAASQLKPPYTSMKLNIIHANGVISGTATLLQMVETLAWVYRHIGAHGGDPHRITVVGHSAGGHLAAMMLACDWTRMGDDLPVSSLVKNAMAMSGLFDLEPVMHTPSVQASLHLTPEQVAKASPARLPAPALREGRGGLMAVVGAEESSGFLRQNRLIQQAWGEQVVPVCESLKGINHFSIVDALADPRSRLHRLVRSLLGL